MRSGVPIPEPGDLERALRARKAEEAAARPLDWPAEDSMSGAKLEGFGKYLLATRQHMRELAAAHAPREEGPPGQNPEDDFKVSIPDPWSRQLFLELAVRQGLKPYRRSGQKAATIMLRGGLEVIEAFWATLQALDASLHARLHATVTSFIAEALAKGGAGRRDTLV